MTFRDRLLATIRSARPVLEVTGVLVVGSEVPNLLQPDAASTLVVSQDLDLAVPVGVHPLVKERLEVRLDAALFGAEALALVRFESEAGAGPPPSRRPGRRDHLSCRGRPLTASPLRQPAPPRPRRPRGPRFRSA